MNRYGYTLLEVTLFLAISGALAVVALIGLGPRLTNVRFTDAVRSLESTSTKQLRSFQAGENVRESVRKCVAVDGPPIRVSFSSPSGTVSGVGAEEACVLNGKVAIFKQDGVDYYPIVSRRSAPTGCPVSANPLLCYGPTIVNNAYAGISKQISLYRNGATNQAPATAAYGYLQDPNSTRIYPFVIPSDQLTTEIINDADNVQLGAVNTQFTTDQQACVNLRLGSRQARILYKTNSLTPETTFEMGC